MTFSPLFSGGGGEYPLIAKDMGASYEHSHENTTKNSHVESP